MRQLIINADDFGLTPGVNRAIIEAHRRGVVRSTTLMANAPAFEDALRLARETPTLDIGCHVVLVDGEPILDPAEIPTLVAGDKKEFRSSIKSFAAVAIAGRLDPAEIEREATAQVRRIQDAGLTVTHLDTHKHAHMFKPVRDALLRVARSCSVGGIRNPFVPVRPLATAQLVRRPSLWPRYSETKALRQLGNGFRREVNRAGLVTTDGSFGVVSTGALDGALFEAIVGTIPDGLWEFVCHPGYHDPDLDRIRTRLRDSRPLELEVLTSPAARAALDRNGVSLISYAGILLHAGDAVR